MKFLALLTLISTTTAITIDCHFSYDHDWHEIGQVYTCEVTSIDFSGNLTHITAYNGIHVPGNSSTDVRAFYFGTLCPQFNLTFIPKGFLQFFPNFNMLEFNTCSIESLNGDELEEYPNLERFVLLHSNIQRIPGNLFEFNQNLKYVWFGFKITRVGEGLLDDLGRLEQAYFWDNSCINQTALSAAEVPELIENLRVNCPDVQPTIPGEFTTNEGMASSTEGISSTTEGMTTVTSQINCEIDNLEIYVCGLSNEVNLWENNFENLRIQFYNLEQENQNLRENVENLRTHNENLERNFEDLIERVENLESLMRK